MTQRASPCALKLTMAAVEAGKRAKRPAAREACDIITGGYVAPGPVPVTLKMAIGRTERMVMFDRGG